MRGQSNTLVLSSSSARTLCVCACVCCERGRRAEADGAMLNIYSRILIDEASSRCLQPPPPPPPPPPPSPRFRALITSGWNPRYSCHSPCSNMACPPS